MSYAVETRNSGELAIPVLKSGLLNDSEMSKVLMDRMSKKRRNSDSKPQNRSISAPLVRDKRKNAYKSLPHMDDIPKDYVPPHTKNVLSTKRPKALNRMASPSKPRTKNLKRLPTPPEALPPLLPIEFKAKKEKYTHDMETPRIPDGVFSAKMDDSTQPLLRTGSFQTFNIQSTKRSNQLTAKKVEMSEASTETDNIALYTNNEVVRMGSSTAHEAIRVLTKFDTKKTSSELLSLYGSSSIVIEEEIFRTDQKILFLEGNKAKHEECTHNKIKKHLLRELQLKLETDYSDMVKDTIKQTISNMPAEEMSSTIEIQNVELSSLAVQNQKLKKVLDEVVDKLHIVQAHIDDNSLSQLKMRSKLDKANSALVTEKEVTALLEGDVSLLQEEVEELMQKNMTLQSEVQSLNNKIDKKGGLKSRSNSRGMLDTVWQRVEEEKEKRRRKPKLKERKAPMGRSIQTQTVGLVTFSRPITPVEPESVVEVVVDRIEKLKMNFPQDYIRMQKSSEAHTRAEMATLDTYSLAEDNRFSLDSGERHIIAELHECVSEEERPLKHIWQRQTLQIMRDLALEQPTMADIVMAFMRAQRENNRAAMLMRDKQGIKIYSEMERTTHKQDGIINELREEKEHLLDEVDAMRRELRHLKEQSVLDKARISELQLTAVLDEPRHQDSPKPASVPEISLPKVAFVRKLQNDLELTKTELIDTRIELVETQQRLKTIVLDPTTQQEHVLQERERLLDDMARSECILLMELEDVRSMARETVEENWDRPEVIAGALALINSVAVEVEENITVLRAVDVEDQRSQCADGGITDREFSEFGSELGSEISEMNTQRSNSSLHGAYKALMSARTALNMLQNQKSTSRLTEHSWPSQPTTPELHSDAQNYGVSTEEEDNVKDRLDKLESSGFVFDSQIADELLEAFEMDEFRMSDLHEHEMTQQDIDRFKVHQPSISAIPEDSVHLTDTDTEIGTSQSTLASDYMLLQSRLMDVTAVTVSGFKQQFRDFKESVDTVEDDMDDEFYAIPDQSISMNLIETDATPVKENFATPTSSMLSTPRVAEMQKQKSLNFAKELKSVETQTFVFMKDVDTQKYHRFKKPRPPTAPRAEVPTDKRSEVEEPKQEDAENEEEFEYEPVELCEAEVQVGAKKYTQRCQTPFKIRGVPIVSNMGNQAIPETENVGVAHGPNLIESGTQLSAEVLLEYERVRTEVLQARQELKESLQERKQAIREVAVLKEQSKAESAKTTSVYDARDLILAQMDDLRDMATKKQKKMREELNNLQDKYVSRREDFSMKLDILETQILQKKKVLKRLDHALVGKQERLEQQSGRQYDSDEDIETEVSRLHKLHDAETQTKSYDPNIDILNPFRVPVISNEMLRILDMDNSPIAPEETPYRLSLRQASAKPNRALDSEETPTKQKLLKGSPMKAQHTFINPDEANMWIYENPYVIRSISPFIKIPPKSHSIGIQASFIDESNFFDEVMLNDVRGKLDFDDPVVTNQNK
ncbi:hypothetical protein PCE1_004369 [Barthelona sp. PCE]